MPDSNVTVGELWQHRSGLTLRVIGQQVPGDRNDELRVWCEVVSAASVHEEDYSEPYAVGDRDGWCLLDIYGWKKVV